MSANEITPRVYIASLSAYNAGKLHGVWIDLEGKDAADIQEEVNAMLANCPENNRPCPSEEWAIHDYEMGGIKVGEWESFENLAKITEAIEEHGDTFLAACQNWDWEEAIRIIEDGGFYGEARDKEDWAAEFLDQTGDLQSIPEHLRNYFDYAAYARDLELSGEFTFIQYEGSIYVFSGNV